jgi:Na+-transporting NADH:ubiquinone oxidoreductase subunit C
MKFNTNSNTYIIIYSVVMVVIVAVLLSLAALGLKSRQDENILNEKKTQIVKALGEDPATVAYDSVIAKAVILDAAGNVVSENVGEVFTALNDLKGSFAAERFPLFIANSGVVVPLYGAGLWGPIWGYIALDADMNTVKGIVLDHAGDSWSWCRDYHSKAPGYVSG